MAAAAPPGGGSARAGAAKRPAGAGKQVAKPRLKASKPKPRLTQRRLEAAILRRCAAGTDRLDRRMAPGVEVLQVKPGTTDSPLFPRPWSRREGGRVAARGAAEWYLPPGADPRRRMLFLHGGSYAVYAPCDAVYRSLASRLAAACKVCVLSVDYRMAPEHLFPAAFEDSLASLAWMATHGPGSPTEVSPASDLFVCGDSAGGGLALAICVRPPSEAKGLLRGAVPLSAWADLTASTPSYETRRWDAERGFGDAVNAGTTRKSGQEEAEVYLGRGGLKAHGRDWRASPHFAPAPLLRAMPAVLFHVGDYELIKDESVLLHERMLKAGHRDATLSVYPRMWHCWHEYAEGGGAGQPLAAAARGIGEVGRWVVARFSGRAKRRPGSLRAT